MDETVIVDKLDKILDIPRGSKLEPEKVNFLKELSAQELASYYLIAQLNQQNNLLSYTSQQDDDFTNQFYTLIKYPELIN